jgi:formylglycine-generating enzyme required for sulfatase activity
MKKLRLALILAIVCLLLPFAGMFAYKAYKIRETKKYDAVFSQPVTPAHVEITQGTPFTNSVGMRFVYIPAGRFIMGSPPDEIGRNEFEFQHEVVISRGFYLQTTEVTQALWQSVMQINPSEHKGDELPVHDVSWIDSKKFIRRLNQIEGDTKYRLPSEAEWEYACRAGSQKAFSSGALTVPGSDLDPLLAQVSWYKANSGGSPQNVGTKSSNAWGLYDMHGNVWEWCQDWWERWYGKFSGQAIIDPAGPPRGRFKIIRGGGWFAGATYQRSASRMRAKPGSKSPGIGFRVARSP